MLQFFPFVIEASRRHPTICSIFFQEPAKTKHPQLHYESKLYMYLHGGGNHPTQFVCFDQNVDILKCLLLF